MKFLQILLVFIDLSLDTSIRQYDVLNSGRLCNSMRFLSLNRWDEARRKNFVLSQISQIQMASSKKLLAVSSALPSFQNFHFIEFFKCAAKTIA